MDFVKHPQHSHFVGKPVGWNEERDGSCGDLSIHMTHSSGMPVMESAWAPTLEEAVALSLGLHQLRLGIFGVKHPVVYMGTAASEVSRDELAIRLQRAAQWLADIAKSNDFRLSVTNSGIGDAASIAQIMEKHA